MKSGFPAALYRATRLEELIRLFVAFQGEPGLLPWVLLWPGAAERQTLVSDGGCSSLGLLTAEQIVGIRIPVTGHPVTRQANWAAPLVQLLAHQFPFARNTVALAPVWRRDELLAIAGVYGPAEAADAQEAKAAVYDLALALKRLRELETLRQDFTAREFLLTNYQRPLVLARANGSVVAGTTSGFGALKYLLHGDRRPSVTTPEQCLPERLLEMKRTAAGRVAWSHQITTILSQLPGGQAVTTADPCLIVEILIEKPHSAGLKDSDVQKLTVTQKEVFEFLLRGLRNKEIGDKLGISTHTVRHHVSAVLSKMQCVDRLQLVTRSAQSAASQGIPAQTDPQPPAYDVPALGVLGAAAFKQSSS